MEEEKKVQPKKSAPSAYLRRGKYKDRIIKRKHEVRIDWLGNEYEQADLDEQLEACEAIAKILDVDQKAIIGRYWVSKSTLARGSHVGGGKYRESFDITIDETVLQWPKVKELNEKEGRGLKVGDQLCFTRDKTPWKFSSLNYIADAHREERKAKLKQ